MDFDTLGHYRIVDRIGEGGMGVVYKARDTHLDRFVALKVVRPDGLSDPGRRHRFIAEARATSALNHPNILTIHDINEDQGVVFIVMEYLDGRTLLEAIGRKGLRVPEAIRMAIQVAMALECAHAEGVVHRDLKPANIMVTSGGHVKVLDFGLAKLLEPDLPAIESATVTAQPITAAGTILGTIAYMSPEQAEGRRVDTRSDVFSFGAVLYEMLTGIPAFARESQVSTLTAVMRDMPRPIGDSVEGVPDELERLVSMCLQKDPGRRIQHMSDVRVLLERMKEESGSGLRPPSVVMVAPARIRRGVAVALAAATFVLAAAAAAFYWYRGHPLSVQIADVSPTAFTFDEGLTFFPALSHDGSLAAFTSDRNPDGYWDIYVQQTSGSQAIRITRDPAADLMPDFSPDGSKLVFRSERAGGGIYVVDALTGTSERKIATRGVYPRFSPDGRRVSVVVTSAGSGSAYGNGIFLISLDGSSPVALEPGFSVAWVSLGPLWSPDGKYLLVEGDYPSVPGSFDWWALPVDGGAPVRTFARKSLDIAAGPQAFPCAWTPQGVLYVVGGTVEGADLYVVSSPGADFRFTGPPRRVTSSTRMILGAAVSNTGRLLYPLLDFTPNYWTVGLDAQHLQTTGVPRKITSESTMKLDAAISRDGTRMGYVTALSLREHKVEVRLKEMASGNETRLPLTGRGSSPYFLNLNADGSLVAFRDMGEKKMVTYLARTDGSSKAVFCDDCYMMRFTSLPHVAYVYKNNTVVRRDVVTGVDTHLLDIPLERINDAAASADDRWLSILLDNPDRSADIAVASLSRLPIAERDLRVVVHEEQYLVAPRWSADGMVLYFLSQRDGFRCIWALRIDPATGKAVGEPYPVDHQHGRQSRFGPAGLFSFDVAKDALLYSLVEMRGNLWTAMLPNGKW